MSSEIVREDSTLVDGHHRVLLRYKGYSHCCLFSTLEQTTMTQDEIDQRVEDTRKRLVEIVDGVGGGDGP